MRALLALTAAALVAPAAASADAGAARPPVAASADAHAGAGRDARDARARRAVGPALARRRQGGKAPGGHLRRGRARVERARSRTALTAEAAGTHAGQSLGLPWRGALRAPAQLPDGDGYHIRRPWRTFGTAAAVAFVRRAIAETRDAFPETHVLAVGDLSQREGGAITEHHSHQSGRDVDLGLFYTAQPARYPDQFVVATEDNLDCAATWRLVEAFAATAREDGGAQVIFLDFDVQGMLYRWARAHDVPERTLDRVLQYPHGRRSGDGLVRHVPNHRDHLHVRFKCPADDRRCR